VAARSFPVAARGLYRPARAAAFISTRRTTSGGGGVDTEQLPRLEEDDDGLSWAGPWWAATCCAARQIRERESWLGQKIAQRGREKENLYPFFFQFSCFKQFWLFAML
jgi:hypothetical protein